MNLEETAYTFIKEKIQTLEWLPGYQIRENDIAAELNISRTPIRKAFDELIEDGYIDKQNNKGVFVSEGILSKKDYQDRIEFLETLLIDYFQELQRKDFDFPLESLNEPLEQMKADVNGNHDSFLSAEHDFWENLLEYHDNAYEKGLIIRTLHQALNQKGYIEKVLSGSRKDKFIHMNKMSEYLGENNYPYARREIRILFNQLVLNVFQGSKDMFNR